MIYFGADHRGFSLKTEVKKYIIAQGFKAEDLGAFEYDENDDYPDFASAVAAKISEKPETHKGVMICGSGHGVDIVANKFKGVRAALCFNRQVAAQSREHEDANVLVLPSDWVNESEAKDILLTWLEGKFDGAERNIRRIGKVEKIENENLR